MTRALIVGMGGLGCPASLALAPSLAQLTLVDFDVVDASNLHRQLWHHPRDLGRLKVDSASEKLARAFPKLELVALTSRIDAQNADALLAGHDVVIDGTDAAETKFVLNDSAVRLKVPLIYGGVLRFTGQLMRIEPGGPCLRCLFDGPPAQAPTCAQAGVLGSMAGVIGGLQARAALRPNPRAGEAPLQIVDGENFSVRTVTVRKSRDCPVCS